MVSLALVPCFETFSSDKMNFDKTILSEFCKSLCCIEMLGGISSFELK